MGPGWGLEWAPVPARVLAPDLAVALVEVMEVEQAMVAAVGDHVYQLSVEQIDDPLGIRQPAADGEVQGADNQRVRTECQP